MLASDSTTTARNPGPSEPAHLLTPTSTARSHLPKQKLYSSLPRTRQEQKPQPSRSLGLPFKKDRTRTATHCGRQFADELRKLPSGDGLHVLLGFLSDLRRETQLMERLEEGLDTSSDQEELRRILDQSKHSRAGTETDMVADDMDIDDTEGYQSERARSNSSGATGMEGQSAGLMHNTQSKKRKRLGQNSDRRTPFDGANDAVTPPAKRRSGRPAGASKRPPPLIVFVAILDEMPLDDALTRIEGVDGVSRSQAKSFRDSFRRMQEPSTLINLQAYLRSVMLTTFPRDSPPDVPLDAPLSLRQHVSTFHQIEQYNQHVADKHGVVWKSLCISAAVHWNTIRRIYQRPSRAEAADHDWLVEIVSAERLATPESSSTGISILKAHVQALLSYGPSNDTWELVIGVGQAAEVLAQVFSQGILALMPYTTMRDLGHNLLRKTISEFDHLRPSLRHFCVLLNRLIVKPLLDGTGIDAEVCEKFLVKRSAEQWGALAGPVAALFGEAGSQVIEVQEDEDYEEFERESAAEERSVISPLTEDNTNTAANGALDAVTRNKTPERDLVMPDSSTRKSSAAASLVAMIDGVDGAYHAQSVKR